MLKKIVVEIRLNSEISLLNFEKRGTNLLKEDHYSLVIVKQFLLLFLACSSVSFNANKKVCLPSKIVLRKISGFF